MWKVFFFVAVVLSDDDVLQEHIIDSLFQANVSVRTHAQLDIDQIQAVQRAEVATFGDEIAAHEADLEAWNGDLKASAAVRGIDREKFNKKNTDYSESISALESAIAVLKTTSNDKKQASLLQVRELTNVDMIPTEAKKALHAFLQQGAPSGLDAQATESGGVVDMLEKLLDKFTREKTVLEKKESDSKHAYELLKQDLESSVEQAEKDVASKSRAKAAAAYAGNDASSPDETSAYFKMVDAHMQSTSALEGGRAEGDPILILCNGQAYVIDPSVGVKTPEMVAKEWGHMLNDDNEAEIAKEAVGKGISLTMSAPLLSTIRQVLHTGIVPKKGQLTMWFAGEQVPDSDMRAMDTDRAVEHGLFVTWLKGIDSESL